MSLAQQYAYSLVWLVVLAVSARFTDIEGEGEQKRDWVRRIQNSKWRYALTGLVVGFCGWYTDVVLSPMIRGYLDAGPVMTLWLVAQVIIAVGIAVPVARWAVFRAYRFWHDPNKE
jgi:hypothetical protein